MNQRRAEIAAEIEDAFAHVRLGEGVSMRESVVLDDYGSLDERQAARALDEKDDWRKLTDDPDLTKYFGLGYSGLCFLDAAGVRFYLPACMIRVLKSLDEGEVEADLSESLYFLLAASPEDPGSRLFILDLPQRRSVLAFLFYVREVLDPENPTLEQTIECFQS